MCARGAARRGKERAARRGAGVGMSGTMLFAAARSTSTAGACGTPVGGAGGAGGAAASAAASATSADLPMPLSVFWRLAMASARCAECDSSSCTSLMPSSAFAHLAMAAISSSCSAVSAAGSEIACGTVESGRAP